VVPLTSKNISQKAIRDKRRGSVEWVRIDQKGEDATEHEDRSTKQDPMVSNSRPFKPNSELLMNRVF
jgi:hypothetical protein